MTQIAILGAGSWGTALAVILSRARKAHEISLWVHNAALAEAMQHHRENNTYLPGVALPAGIQVTHEIPAALERAHIVIGVMPSVHARGIYSQVLPCVSREMIFVSATKGLEPATPLRMSKVIAQILTQAGAATNTVMAMAGGAGLRDAGDRNPRAVLLGREVMVKRGHVEVVEVQEDAAVG